MSKREILKKTLQKALDAKKTGINPRFNPSKYISAKDIESLIKVSPTVIASGLAGAVGAGAAGAVATAYNASKAKKEAEASAKAGTNPRALKIQLAQVAPSKKRATVRRILKATSNKK